MCLDDITLIFVANTKYEQIRVYYISDAPHFHALSQVCWSQSLGNWYIGSIINMGWGCTLLALAACYWPSNNTHLVFFVSK